MINITLSLTDCIQTVLPVIEAAMETGEVCQLGNVHYLGSYELAALLTLATATHLRDAETGKIYHAHPDFHLIGVDSSGVTRSLVN